MTFIEKINNRFPALGKKFSEFSHKRKSTVWQDMFLCTAVTLCVAFYEFERFVPAVAVNFISTVLTALFVICWMWCAFLNGFWKKYSFLIFTAVFWLVPRLVILREENAGILNYNKYLDAMSQYSRLLVEFPFLKLSDLFNTSGFLLTVSFLMWCVLMYFAGGHFKKIINP